MSCPRRCVKAVMYFYVPDEEDNFSYWWNRCPGVLQLYNEKGKKLGKTRPFDNLAFPMGLIEKAKNRLYKIRKGVR